MSFRRSLWLRLGGQRADANAKGIRRRLGSPLVTRRISEGLGLRSMSDGLVGDADAILALPSLTRRVTKGRFDSEFFARLA